MPRINLCLENNLENISAGYYAIYRNIVIDVLEHSLVILHPQQIRLQKQCDSITEKLQIIHFSLARNLYLINV